jgi:hypothetical protein
MEGDQEPHTHESTQSKTDEGAGPAERDARSPEGTFYPLQVGFSCFKVWRPI